MLLPSAFSLQNYLPSSSTRPQRPKLQSYGPYEAQPTTPLSLPAGLAATCRSLQSMLAGPTKTTQATQDEDIAMTTPQERTRQDLPILSLKRLQSAASIFTVSRGTNKRRRDDFEDEDEDEDVESVAAEEAQRSCSNVVRQHGTNDRHDTHKRSKRLRHCHENSNADMNVSMTDVSCTLQAPSRQYITQPCQEQDSFPADYFYSERDEIRASRPKALRGEQQTGCTPTEGSRLFGNVLGKADLSRQDWNDSARLQNGVHREQGNLGRRWSWLFGKSSSLGGWGRGYDTTTRPEILVGH